MAKNIKSKGLFAMQLDFQPQKIIYVNALPSIFRQEAAL